MSTPFLPFITPANAATLTFGSSTGVAQYANSNFGQTFTMPATGGDLVSISNVFVAFRGSTGLGVVQTKLYTSTAKTTLVATASNTCSDNVSDFDNFQGVNCTFNFSGVTLSGSTVYYFEVARISGEASFFMWQYNTNGYAGGDMYQNGTLYAGWDNRFTVTYNTVSTPTSSFSINDSIFMYRKASNISFQSNVAGKARFRANGKNIGGCVSLMLNSGNSFSVTCPFRPTSRKTTTISIYFVPTDTGYTAQNFTSGQIRVTNRTSSRG
ncbi:MAG: hypothetical protein F2602_03190 [Actinobacteria bacterium]|nr:hypothetical protein [Actinomycetota bacterium]MTA21418.1 hypothetical protein [Actinomycetota bacterium]